MKDCRKWYLHKAMKRGRPSLIFQNFSQCCHFQHYKIYSNIEFWIWELHDFCPTLYVYSLIITAINIWNYNYLYDNIIGRSYLNVRFSCTYSYLFKYSRWNNRNCIRTFTYFCGGKKTGQFYSTNFQLQRENIK